LLDAWGVPYTAQNIRADIETMLAFRRKGYMEVPVVEAGTAALTDYAEPEQLAAWLRGLGYTV